MSAYVKDHYQPYAKVEDCTHSVAVREKITKTVSTDIHAATEIVPPISHTACYRPHYINTAPPSGIL